MVSPPVPRFRLMPVLVGGLLLYLVMAFFFGAFFLAADLMKARALDPSVPAGAPPGATWTIGLELAVLAVGLGAVVLWHRPLARTLEALRKGQVPADRDRTLARRRVFLSPLVTGLAVPLVTGLVLAAVAWAHHAGAQGVGRIPLEVRSLPVNLMFLALTAFFLYLWQRHRIQTRYLAPLFTPTELASRLPPTRDRSIALTLGLLAVLSAVLPVAVVLTLLATGVTHLPDATALTEAQWTLLLGSSALGHTAFLSLETLGLTQVPVVLINTVDTYRVLLGSALGVTFILGYVFFVFRWAAQDLTGPLFALRDAMARVEAGEAVPPQPVVTSNEVGELTLGFNRMMKGLGERDRIKGLFGQYLTREVSEAILDGRVNLGGDRYEVTVLFTDIRDFTALSESLSPEEVFGFLNEYLDAMIEVLVARGGFIDKFLGDGILTVFGLPVRSEDHALAAFEAARDMQHRLADLNARRAAAGQTPIAIGAGLHTGPVIAGNVGSVQKTEFTVIGDTVNLASRLEGLNKRYGSALTLSEAAWDRLPPDLRASLPFVREEGVEIRGKKDPVTLYRLDALEVRP